MDTIAGLPAHPLIVHFPLVAIPLAAILVVLFVLIPSWRTVLAYLMIAMGGAIAISVFLAANSGEALKENVDKSAAVSAHADLGDQLQTIGIVFGVALVALGLYHVLSVRQLVRLPDERARPLLLVLMAAAIVTGSVAVVWDVRTGHSGAKAAWSEQNKNGQTEGSSGGDDDAMTPRQVALGASGSPQEYRFR